MPPGRRAREEPLRRRTPPRGHLPSAPRAARHPAPGRAHEPPGRGERGVAREVPRHVHGHRRRDHARSLLPGQRRGVDPRARPRRGHPVRGQLQRLVGVQVQAAGIRAEEAGRAVANDQPGAGVGEKERQGPAEEGQGSPSRVRGTLRRGQQVHRASGPRQHHDPRRPTPRRRRRGREGRVQGVRGPRPAHRRTRLHDTARRRRRHRRRQRRRQDDAVQDDHRNRRARQGRGCRGRDGQADVRGPEPRFAERRQDRLRGALRRRGGDLARDANRKRARVLQLVQLQELRSAEEGRAALRRRAQSFAARQDAHVGG
mmetsp:Transcript_395/g.1600  ORF Transcript_395/g.1600 Transcript_395/m.1600 type:complete len:315 (-) Transcript_395:365-1309(-)